MRRTEVIKVLLSGLMIALVLNGCHKRTGMQIGDTIPTVTLIDFQGNSVTLPEDIKGKVTLVRFWSIDCSFCDKGVLLSLEKFYQKYKDKGFMPVAINESSLEENDVGLKQFAGLTYPMLVDEYALVAKKFGVIGLPTTFVIDEDGIVRDKLVGEAKTEEFEKLFTTVLNKGAVYESGY
jgi:cytochrome c biogenesis protein CcmG, thiol:disulfide interchange protein DsbE